jgi:putative membrane protein
MTNTLFRLSQIAILFGLAIFFAERIISGKLLWYINIRFAYLSVIGAVGLFALGVNALYLLYRQRKVASCACSDDASHHHHHHQHSPINLCWLSLPLVLALLIPAQPLSADVASTKGVSLDGRLPAANNAPATFDIAADQRNVLDWIRIFNYETNLSPYLEEEANVIGFVLEDPRLPDGHFLVARFTVSCCVADAFAIGMAVAWPEDLPVNSWVRVRGPVDVLEVEGQRVPLIHAASIIPEDFPDQPYLFP